jgi:hypothetical protein
LAFDALVGLRAIVYRVSDLRRLHHARDPQAVERLPG